MIIRFDLGDWSADGHEKVLCYLLTSSHPAQEVANAYHAGCRQAGFILHERVCAEYQEHAIRAGDVDRLRELGYQPRAEFDPEWVTGDDLLDMFCFMARLGSPGLSLAEWEPETFFQAGVPDRSFSLGYGVL